MDWIFARNKEINHLLWRKNNNNSNRKEQYIMLGRHTTPIGNLLGEALIFRTKSNIHSNTHVHNT